MRAGVRREMLRRDRHSRLLRARGEAARERRDDGCFAMQRAVADDLSEAEVEIDARREAQVDADGAQLGGHEPAARAGRPAARDRGPRRRAGRARAAAAGGRTARESAAHDRPRDRRSRATAAGARHGSRRPSAASCSTLAKLRVNRMTPPTSGDSSHSRSSGAMRRATQIDHQRTERHALSTRPSGNVHDRSGRNQIEQLDDVAIRHANAADRARARRAAPYPACRGYRCSGALYRLAQDGFCRFPCRRATKCASRSNRGRDERARARANRSRRSGGGRERRRSRARRRRSWRGRRAGRAAS